MGTCSVFSSKSLLTFISLTTKWRLCLHPEVLGLTVREVFWNPLLKGAQQVQSTNIKKGLYHIYNAVNPSHKYKMILPSFIPYTD